MEITRAGHLCGNVIGDTYYTHREQNHFMIMFQGFGISEEILMKLKHCGVVWVIIDYAGVRGEVKYRCKLQKFLESYKEYTFEDPHNRFGGEFDLQKFVSIRDMDNANDKIIKREVQGTL